MSKAKKIDNNFTDNIVSIDFLKPKTANRSYTEIVHNNVSESATSEDLQLTPVNDIPVKQNHPNMTDPLTRPELDAKLETIETRMDGRLALIENRFASIENTMAQIGRMLNDQKNIPWKAAAATIAAMIATVIAVVALGFGAFDSGRETAKLAAEAQVKTAQTQEQTARLIAEAEVKAAQAQKDTAAALAEIRAIVSDLKKKPQ